MRTVFLSALVGASVSFASYTARQTRLAGPRRGSVDLDSAVMLRHEAIPELKWPAMTMPFTLSAGATLNGAKPGMR